MTILPDCMMPDGAEPCKAYQHVAAENEQLRKALKKIIDIRDNHSIGLQNLRASNIARKALTETK